MQFPSTFRKLLVILLIACQCHYVKSLAVMAVDMGSEWMKVAIVSPGVPMEIALNRESQRKSPVAVAFRDGERFFGDPALSISVRFPDKAYLYLLDVLGKKIDNPLVDLYKKRFPYHVIEPTEDRKSVLFMHPDGLIFTVEELVAMLLKQAQKIAEKTAGQPIKDAVITVPSFFSQAERRAMLQAAKLSGLNVLQLINSNTAVALNYGVFRRRDFNETPSNILFYDMGAGSTVATVVTYQLMKSKETGEVNPQLTVKGVGFDRTLGGLEMQLRLRNHLADSFNKAEKTEINVFKNNRAMAKLFKESGRVKKVLSANADHVAQIESLLDDKDFKSSVTRAQFEELCSDLFERVTQPIDEALKSANIDLMLIDQVILSGSGARVPMVQQKLLDHIQKPELGKSLNTDESAALGGAYQAAHLSKGFKVKTFLIKDTNLYPIQVDFHREYELEDKTIGKKTVKRILFGRNNGMPLKKIMTFNRHVKDFEFFINYGELNFLTEFGLRALGSINITQVFLKGVKSAILKNMDDQTEYKGIKAYFRLDESGILNLDTVEAVFDKIGEEVVESDIKSAFTKLGDTIGRLFSGSKPQEETPVKDETKTSSTIETNGTDSQHSDEKKQNVSNETRKDEGTRSATEIKKEPSVVSIKEPISSSSIFLDLPEMHDDQISQSIKRLIALDDHDYAIFAKAKSKNSLESFIVETKDKLYQEEYERATTEEEKEIILKSLGEAGDWLEYESDDATTEMFRTKLGDLKKLTKELFDRIKEHQERPEALKALNDMLNISQIFLAGAQNMSEDDQIFTEVEIKTLETLIKETKKWYKESIAEQKAIPLSSPVKLTVKLISEKIANLDREVKYLLNKARFSQPLKKKSAVKEPVNNESAENITISEKDASKSSNVTLEQISDSVTEDSTAQIIDVDVPDIAEATSEDSTSASREETGSQPEVPSPDQVEDPHSEL